MLASILKTEREIKLKVACLSGAKCSHFPALATKCCRDATTRFFLTAITRAICVRKFLLDIFNIPN